METPEFQSTLPVRGATPGRKRYSRKVRISIHAPREGSDMSVVVSFTVSVEFQSTLPVRGATWSIILVGFIKKFQSTLPVRGATQCRLLVQAAKALFQSTLPVRGATIWARRKCSW